MAQVVSFTEDQFSSNNNPSPSLYAEEESLIFNSPSKYCTRFANDDHQKHPVASTSTYHTSRSGLTPRSMAYAFIGAPLQQQVVPGTTGYPTETAIESHPRGAFVDLNQNAGTSAVPLIGEDPLTISKEFVRPAQDLNLLSDERVLFNLQQMEMDVKRMPKRDYFRSVQTDIAPCMRKVVTQWMLDVCDEEKADPEVFPLACSYLDRFLSKEAVYKTQLQGLACTCIFIASKIKQPTPINARKLVEYTDNYIELGQLMSWELLLLNRLEWDTSAVTAFDFVDHLLVRMGLPASLLRRLKPMIIDAIRACGLELKLATLPPSVQACISICLAGMRVMEDRDALPGFRTKIYNAIGIQPRMLNAYVEEAENLFNNNSAELQ